LCKFFIEKTKIPALKFICVLFMYLDTQIVFSELTEHIRNCCIGGKDCTKCGYCDKAYEYEYENIKYCKCQFICFNFRFENIDELDIDSIIRVLDMELEEIR